MKASEIIQQDAERNGVSPEAALSSVKKQIQFKNALLLQENDSVVLLTEIAPKTAEIHLFTVEKMSKLVSSIKGLLEKIKNSNIDLVYGKADNPEIIRLMQLAGVPVEESDNPNYNWKAQTWAQ